MIRGVVGSRGVPEILLRVAGHNWPATLDTGFNGDLELPRDLFGRITVRFHSRIRSKLASGHRIEEDSHVLELWFDGDLVQAVATFAPVHEILVGTRLLQRHRLQIDFVKRSVLLERAV